MKQLYSKIPTPKELSVITRYDSNEETHPCDVELSNSAVDRIWTSVEDLYRTGMSPAISFCLRKNGKIILNRSIGYLDKQSAKIQDHQSLITPNDPICLFSASKAITAFLVHLLIEEGKLKLNDPVADYYPDFAKHGKSDITINNLLSHDVRFSTLKFGQQIDPELIFDFEGTVALLCNSKLSGKLGNSQAYNAIFSGYILGGILEKASGKNLKTLMQEKIQNPLGTHYLNYGLNPEDQYRVAEQTITGLASKASDMYIKHIIGADLKTIVNISNDKRYMDACIPPANIYATAEEVSRFYQMLLNGGEFEGTQICSPETVKNAISEVHGMKWDSKLLVPMRYSNGFMLGAQPFGLFGPNSEQSFGHIGLSNIMTWADTERDISVSLLTTGKSVIGAHLIPWVRLVHTIGAECGKRRHWTNKLTQLLSK